MPLEKWDPYHDLIRLRNIFSELFDRTFGKQMLDGGLASEYWAPNVDVVEGENDILVTAEIPGVKRESIHIEYNGNQLTIKGERLALLREGEATFHRLERQHGSFKREIPIQARIDPSGIKASLDAGVLSVVLPLDPHAKAKNIPIVIKS